MAIDPELVRILVCPQCKSRKHPLQLRGDQSAFVCEDCRLIYAVVDGIPNFLVDEAQALEQP